LATMVTPRTARFYAAVAVLTLGPDIKIANTVRDLTPAVGALLEVIAAEEKKYARGSRRSRESPCDLPHSRRPAPAEETLAAAARVEPALSAWESDRSAPLGSLTSQVGRPRLLDWGGGGSGCGPRPVRRAAGGPRAGARRRAPRHPDHSRQPRLLDQAGGQPGRTMKIALAPKPGRQRQTRSAAGHPRAGGLPIGGRIKAATG
jgi:hypothetical protein